MNSRQPANTPRQSEFDEHRAQVIRRFHSGADATKLPISIEPGSVTDYLALARHHYKAGRPATMKRVYVAHHQHANVTDRFRNVIGHDNGDHSASTVGVLVLSLPRLSCELRDFATGGRYTKLDPRHRAHMLNKEIRTISRVIIDPRYRGLGLAVRLVCHALTHADTVYTEALAAMGRVNPFFERAGMTRYERPLRPEHARLLDVMHEIGIEPAWLASRTRLNHALEETGLASRTWFESEVRRWTCNAFRLSRARRSAITLDECISCARDHLLASCVYYLHHHSQG